MALGVVRGETLKALSCFHYQSPIDLALEKINGSSRMSPAVELEQCVNLQRLHHAHANRLLRSSRSRDLIYGFQIQGRPPIQQFRECKSDIGSVNFVTQNNLY